jgi:hypothetical protein
LIGLSMSSMSVPDRRGSPKSSQHFGCLIWGGAGQHQPDRALAYADMVCIGEARGDRRLADAIDAGRYTPSATSGLQGERVIKNEPPARQPDDIAEPPLRRRA